MEGRVSVERAGRHIYDFRPGDSISGYVRYYVLANSSSPSLGAVSQVEALAQSTCKKVSGDSMSCTSCHDSHYSPSAQERVSYYRGKCLACHGAAFGDKHHRKQQDCTSCHMSASLSKDVAHTEVTDHRILRRPEKSVPQQADAVREANAQLVPFPDSPEAESHLRSFALAWESLANTGVDSARPRAENMLQRAVNKFPRDPDLLIALAYEEQRRGETASARDLYRSSLALNPASIAAAANLGVIEAQEGNLSRTIDLWRGAFDRAPGESNIGINLVRAFCMSGDLRDARKYIERVLEFDPDLDPARKEKAQLNRPKPNCN
jgi:tetratricopeptide (TPR) repeat protein